jgi:predicted O-linked N-acetylglucosamine transferase (SPINDLY family)
LTSLGLPELITTNRAAFEAQAAAYATDPLRLAAVRAKLMVNRLTTPLFDTAQFTRHLEAAYGTMVDRQRAGLPLDQIELGSAP